MSDWKVGDRVQTDDNNVIRVGTVTAVDFHQVERNKYDWHTGKDIKYLKTKIKSIDIQWDDGELQQGLDQYGVSPEDSAIEREFRLTMIDAQARIDTELEKAWQCIQAAVKISEDTGIPFHAQVSPLSQSYFPNSRSQKFPNLDREVCSELARAYGEYEGWQHSSVC